MKVLFLSLTLCFFMVNGQGMLAASQYYFDSWTTDNGLPQNSVNAILQTRDGYLWIATSDGLVRYDGVRFTVFKSENTSGMNSNQCKGLLEDPEGTLWVLTSDGLTSYRDGDFHSYTAASGLPNGFLSRAFIDNEGGFILLTTQGLFRWRDHQSISLLGEGSQPYGHFAYQDRSGGLWFNGADGLFHRMKDGRLMSYRLPGEYPANRVNSACEDSQGNFWIGNNSGLYRLNGDRFTSYGVHQGLPTAKVSSIYEDQQANLWIGTENAGLWRFTVDSGSAQPVTPHRFSVIDYKAFGGIPISRVDCIYRDREDTLWLGTPSSGLIRMNQQTVTTYSKENGLDANNVYPIYEDHEGGIWIGNWEGRLTRYHDGKFTYYRERTLPTAFAEDREGNLWIGKNVGLFRFKDGSFTEKKEMIGLADPYEVTAILQDREGAMWFGTNKGLIKYKDGARTLYTTKDGLAGNEVKAILEDRQGALWFGCYGGLNRFKDGVFTAYTKSDGLGSNRVRSLYEDGGGLLWIGTYDGGLSRLKDGRMTTYSTKEGLFNDGVFQILEDGRGNFWMSSNLGIYRTSKQQLNDFAEGQIQAITCIAYGKRDGLLNIECNGGTQPAGIRARDGRLWFPTQQGVAVINPADVPFNVEPPPVVIEEVLIDRLPAASKGALRMRPGQEGLEIRYSGLSFIKSEQVRFKYKMEGLDKDWVEADTRRAAYYSHLPPGRYRFTVIAANADGVWNLAGASIEIVVIPPFWRTWWFSSSVIISLAVMAIMFYRRRVRLLKRAQVAQEAFSRQLIESQENERKRIAAELHDSLGQSLSIIMNRATLALHKPEDQQRVLDQVGEIASAASEAIKEVREVAYNLRPVELDRLGLTKALQAMVKKVTASTDIRIAADIDRIDDLFTSESEINLYRIVQESVNNIVKHSGASQAKVEIKRLARGIQVIIQDDGKGFIVGAHQASEARSAGFGLMGISERARILGGKPQIQSAPGRGTTISLTIGLQEGQHEE